MKPLDAFTLPYIVTSADRLQTALDGALGSDRRAWASRPASRSSATG